MLLLHNFIFVDPTDDLINYVNSLPTNFNFSELPYLEIDAHMNEVGYNILANKIKEFIEKNHISKN